MSLDLPLIERKRRKAPGKEARSACAAGLSISRSRSLHVRLWSYRRCSARTEFESPYLTRLNEKEPRKGALLSFGGEGGIRTHGKARFYAGSSAYRVQFVSFLTRIARISRPN